MLKLGDIIENPADLVIPELFEAARLVHELGIKICADEFRDLWADLREHHNTAVHTYACYKRGRNLFFLTKKPGEKIKIHKKLEFLEEEYQTSLPSGYTILDKQAVVLTKTQYYKLNCSEYPLLTKDFKIPYMPHDEREKDDALFVMIRITLKNVQKPEELMEICRTYSVDSLPADCEEFKDSHKFKKLVTNGMKRFFKESL